MLDFTKEIQDYALTIWGMTVAVAEFDPASVPFFLQDRYCFARVTIQNTPFLLFWPKHAEAEAPITPTTIRSDADKLREIAKLPPLWAAPRITPYDRQRLIGYRQPFIIPDNQAYLPDLLIDLREHFKAVRRQPVDTLSYTAQRLLLQSIYGNIRELSGLRAMDKESGVSLMTLSRALQELAALGLVETEREGRTLRARFTQPWPELWARALPCLRSPVRKRVYVRGDLNVLNAVLPYAGLTALSEISVLNPPRLLVYAAMKLRPADPVPPWLQQVVKHKEEAAAEIEFWAYAPIHDHDAPHGLVDRLSLYLSLKDQTDERTQDALQTLLKQLL